MNRGDSKSFPFKIAIKGSSPKQYIDGSQYEEVEVQFNSQSTFNSIKKLMSKEEVEWDSTNSCFLVFLTQEDTFKMTDGNNKMQVRLYNDGVCTGSIAKLISLNECLSEEVLK